MCFCSSRVSLSTAACSPAMCSRPIASGRATIAGPGIVTQIFRQVRLMFPKQAGDPRQIGRFGLVHLIGNAGGGHVHTVEHVADVVRDAGGHLGHAGAAGTFSSRS